MKVEEIENRIKFHLEEANFWQKTLDSKSCATCEHFASGTGCALAEGAFPPAEVQKTGCPSWEFDAIPF